MLRKPTGHLLKMLLLSGLALGSSASFSARAGGQDLPEAQQFVQTSNSSEAAQKLLRDGRELIGERKWAEATTKFNDFTRAYPRDTNLKAALYWLAFCLKQQGKLQEAQQTLERLIKEYPRSGWSDDARALQLEIAGLQGNSAAVNSVLEVLPVPAAPAAAPTHPAAPPAPRPDKQQDAAENSAEALRLIALQSLFQADPERALGLALGLLGQDSKASATIQEAALGLIARHGGEKAWPTLVETARNPALAAGVREQAIYWIAHQRSEQALAALIQLYDAEKTAELKDRLLYWLAHSENARAQAKVVEVARGDNSTEARARAIYWIAHRRGAQAFDILNELYGAEKDAALKDRILYWFAHSQDPRAQAKVVEIARNDGSTELRDRAIYWIAHRKGEEAIDTLTRLYDEQRAEETKERILYWLGQRGGKTGLQKLLTVARSDSAQSLRERAVYYLGQSKDPEALKLLEQLIK
jgi:outer membrane protein assembly factor BamD (BamD/ComL family)